MILESFYSLFSSEQSAWNQQNLSAIGGSFPPTLNKQIVSRKDNGVDFDYL